MHRRSAGGRGEAQAACLPLAVQLSSAMKPAEREGVRGSVKARADAPGCRPRSGPASAPAATQAWRGARDQPTHILQERCAREDEMKTCQPVKETQIRRP